MNRPMYQLLSGKFGAGLEIRVLMRRTADVFGVEAPKSAGLSVPELLECYARFTASAAGRAVGSGQDVGALRRELYRMAVRLGSGLRFWLRPGSDKECFAIFRMLYRNIGIEVREGRSGEMIVGKCYFSAFYTPEVCAVISAIDQGIYAGIFAGGRLSFRQRITEGRGECRAQVTGARDAEKSSR